MRRLGPRCTGWSYASWLSRWCPMWSVLSVSWECCTVFGTNRWFVVHSLLASRCCRMPSIFCVLVCPVLVMWSVTRRCSWIFWWMRFQVCSKTLSGSHWHSDRMSRTRTFRNLNPYWYWCWWVQIEYLIPDFVAMQTFLCPVNTCCWYTQKQSLQMCSGRIQVHLYSWMIY